VHASYLINLSSETAGTAESSIEMVARELELADLIGAEYVVLHTGRSVRDNGRKIAAQALRKAISGFSGTSRLLIENTAGQKGDISSRMEDLAEIMAIADSPVIGGVCIDTCHAFQAGYDLSQQEGIDGLVEEIELHLGLDQVKLIHFNDSKAGCNSRLDRHEHIGQGKIGEKGLGIFLHHPALKAIPLILETPKKTEEDDPINLKAVRRLLV
ncbi:MAG: deoxyribonuclease IV, partial [Nitrospirales bacterium]|nr:deoxyribonuclease IV [Nitrospirales bacterium]